MKVKVLIVLDAVVLDALILYLCPPLAYLLSRYMHKKATAIKELVNQIVK